MVDKRIELIVVAFKVDDIHTVKRLFRSVPVSATEFLNEMAEQDPRDSTHQCKDFLNFHAEFEELSGLEEMNKLATLRTRLAMTSIWSDPRSRNAVRLLLNTAQGGELIEFTDAHAQFDISVRSVAEKIAEQFVDESIDAVPLDFSMIECLLGRSTVTMPDETPLVTRIGEFVKLKDIERERQSRAQEHFQSQSAENYLRPASRSRKSVSR